jgi:hypothetical protein
LGWPTPDHLYLLLVGGVPTVYEVTEPGGGPIAGVRGVARMAANVIDMDPDPLSTVAILWSGALVYTDTQLFLTRTHTSISTVEVKLGAASIAGVRGVLPMGGAANSIGLSAAAYVWTDAKLVLHVAGPGGSTSEQLDPSGASVAGVWGMVRHGRPWNGGSTFTGAASALTPGREYFTTTLGPVGLREVLSGTGGSIRSHVEVVPRNTGLRQAGGLFGVDARRVAPGLAPQRGSVIGLGQ